MFEAGQKEPGDISGTGTFGGIAGVSIYAAEVSGA
jgi:hypothetical protein